MYPERASLNKIIGARIKELRKKNRLTQHDFPRIANLPWSRQIQGFAERGLRELSASEIYAICKAFNVDLGYFFNEEKKDLPPIEWCASFQQ